MKERLVIIGGVAAGTKAASKARRDNPNLDIKVYTKDKYISYAGCGLPYYLSGIISDRQELLVRSPEDFKVDQNIEIYIRHQVTCIDHVKKEIMVHDIVKDMDYPVSYNRLIIATGASAVVPRLENVELEGIHTLRSIDDAILIRDRIDKGEIRNAVVVGGGFIGVEAAENLLLKGIKVVMVELFDHILPPFDEEMALLVQNHMKEMGINIITKEKVLGFSGKSGKVKMVHTTGGDFEADLVILSIGVKPNVKFAADSGIELGVTGAIKVNEFMETNLEDIYAAGDCAENVQLVTGKPAWYPMGSTANKMGRIAGENAAFGKKTDRAKLFGVVGTAVVKVGQMNAGRTGLTERDAKKAGFDYETMIVPANDKAHYYPGTRIITTKLVIDKKSKKILGAQVVGEGNIDKPIDEYVAAITLGADYDDLSSMDLAYAPPFNMAMGSSIVTANVMKNKMDGKLHSVNSKELQRLIAEGNVQILDIREEIEHFISAIPGSLNIPMAGLSDRIEELDKTKEIIVIICKVGKRSFTAYKLLRELGFTNVAILEGGTTSYPYELV